MQVKISQAIPVLESFIKAKLVPILTGSPGMGKSQIYQQIADKFKLLLIDVRLSTCDLTDLTGFPAINGNKASYVPMDTFPLEGDEIPNGYSGWLLLFDELTSAVPALQAAAYKILLDRKIGQANLHSHVAVCAAGNLETDNAVVHPMSTALQSRLVHLELAVDATEWIEWAGEHGIDHRITSFINFKPSMLYTFQADHTDKTYACPRTWEFANRVLKITEDDSKQRLPMLTGTLSEGVAREFLTFIAIYKDLPTIQQIVSAPDVVAVPKEPSVLFALTGSIANHATKENHDDLITFIDRLPVEFKVICFREMIRRTNKAAMSWPAMQKWITRNATVLF
jgi:MoxR-like ATPase